MIFCNAAIFSTCILAVCSLAIVDGRSRMMSPLFAFPESRRGRATPPASPLPLVNDPVQDIQVEETPEEILIEASSVAKEEKFLDQMIGQEEMIMEAIKALSQPIIEPSAPVGRVSPKASNKLFSPRKVEDTMNQFGPNMHRSQSDEEILDNFPQLQGQFRDSQSPAMNLGDVLASRQSEATTVDPNSDDIRCIPKVMQIEEIVYDQGIKCHHSYQEKCHLTYITDYQSTSEEKCETTFKKNCHITFKPMPFNETVSICNTPVERSCGEGTVGPDICSTQYETSCETRYNTYEIEQDEPVCTMELEKKCKNVTVTLPRSRRQADTPDATAPDATAPDATAPDATAPDAAATDAAATDAAATDAAATDAAATDAAATDAATSDVVDPDATAPDAEAAVTTTVAPADEGEVLTFDQQCEEWPVQKCSLEKKLVKKVHPETACKKIPREVCVPNNCEMVQGKEICFDENRMQVQNVPQEECELQPEETCHMESVLVPRLIPQPNCVKVPKEICVNTKTNPRKVKKPIVKEWCYRPSDLPANSGLA